MRMEPVQATVEQRTSQPTAGLAVPGSVISGRSAAIVYQFPIPANGIDVVHRPVLSIARTRAVNLDGIQAVAKLRHRQVDVG